MWNRAYIWFISWRTTLKIKFFEPGYYRELRKPIDDLDEFDEVHEPE
jgi:hypothetical protein